MGIKYHGAAKAILLPVNIGRLYYQQGYEEHKNILLDVIHYMFPKANELLTTDLPERVETILQQYGLNLPGIINPKTQKGLILHLINLTGFSGNTYFKPLPVYNRRCTIRCAFKPSKVFGLVSKQPVPFQWKDGRLVVTIKALGPFESIVIDK